LIKTGIKEPSAGSINKIEKILLFSHTPLTLKIMKRRIEAIISTREIAFVAKMLLHTI
jgi:hypothetical protein